MARGGKGKPSLAFTVPGKPVSWARLRVHGRRRYETPEVTAQKQAVGWAAKVAGRQQGIDLPLRWPLALHITAVFKRPQKRGKIPTVLWEMEETPAKALNDVDNLAKLVMDALNGVAYEDDREIVEVRCCKIYGKSPRTEIVLFEVEGAA